MYAALLAGVLLGVFSGVAIYAFANPVLQSKHWASWVQAFGSIAAILGAVYVAGFSEKLRERLQRERHNRAALDAVEAFNKKIEEVSTALNAEYDSAAHALINVYAPKVLDGYLRTLQEVRVLDLPSRKAMVAMLEVQRLSSFYVENLNDAYGGPWKTRHSDKLEVLKKTQKNVEDIKERVKAGSVERSELEIAKEEFLNELRSIKKMQKNFVLCNEKWIQKEIKVLRIALGGKSTI